MHRKPHLYEKRAARHEGKIETRNKDLKAETLRKQNLVEQVLLQNYNTYYRMAMSYTRNEQDAMDIVQSGCERAIRKSHLLEDEKHAGTWVYRIMMNETFRMLKERSKFNSELAGAKSPDEGSADEHSGKTEAVTDSYENFDLHRAMAELAPEERAVIQMRYFDELKLSEIAVILHLNESTVKSKLYRTLDKLHLQLSV